MNHFAQMAKFLIDGAKLNAKGRLMIRKPKKQQYEFSGYTISGNGKVYDSTGVAVYDSQTHTAAKGNTNLQEYFNLTRAFALIEGAKSEVGKKAKIMELI